MYENENHCTILRHYITCLKYIIEIKLQYLHVQSPFPTWLGWPKKCLEEECSIGDIWAIPSWRLLHYIAWIWFVGWCDMSTRELALPGLQVPSCVNCAAYGSTGLPGCTWVTYFMYHLCCSSCFRLNNGSSPKGSFHWPWASLVNVKLPPV